MLLRHSFASVATISHVLGVTGGAATAAAVWAWLAGSPWWSLLAYIALLATFHQLEYATTAYGKGDDSTIDPGGNMESTRALSLDAYLLNHSREYWAAHGAAVAEFLLRLALGINFAPWAILGVIVAAAGQATRTAAMLTAARNFSHDIATRRDPMHQLVTSGIYRWMRHPSYAGFTWWVLGLQWALGNQLCLLGFAVVLYKYFSERIMYEEMLLVQFFRDAYIDYRAAVPWSGVPFVK